MVRRLHSITKECKGHQHYTNATKIHKTPSQHYTTTNTTSPQRQHYTTTGTTTLYHYRNDNTTPLQERQHYTTTLNNQYKSHISGPRFKPTSSQRNQHKCLYSQYIYYYYYYYKRGLKQFLVAVRTLQKTKIRGTIQHGLQGPEIPCTGCVSHIGYLRHGNSKGEARGRSRHKNNSKRVARTWTRRKKSPKQGVASAEDPTIMLLEGPNSPYSKSD